MLLHDVVGLNARRHGDKVAVRMADGTPSRTFAAWWSRSQRLAAALEAVTEHGDRVAILATNCVEYLEAFVGVPAAGTPLALLNYRLHPSEWVWIVNNSSAKVLIVQPELLAKLGDYRSQLTTVERVVVIGDAGGDDIAYDDFLAQAPNDAPVRDVVRTDIAWIVYTSGTTGRPKGAMLSHDNLVAAITQAVIEHAVTEDVVFLNGLPLCHIAGNLALVFTFRGGTVVLMEQWDPAGWMQAVDDWSVTNAALAPTMVGMMLDHPRHPEFSLASLRWLGYGAAKINSALLRRVLARFGDIVSSSMGMTETSGAILTLDEHTHTRAANGEEHLLEAAGKPMPIVDVRVVDPEGKECPPGVVGEIVVRGDQVLVGYLDNPEATAAAFTDGWFHTGDAARVDEEGYFSIVDRMKDMVITGGENVYSTEVENAIYQLPGVAEAAVVGTPDPTWGEIVTAVVVVRDGTTVTEDDVQAVCREHLAGYKVPRIVRFLDELPKTVSGKILKHQLR